MANGDVYNCPIDLDTFEDILSETELITSLPELNEN
jgi:hypothetical protein